MSLPPALTAAIVGLVAVLFAVNVTADIFQPDYDGYPTTMMLGGLLGGALGLDRLVRRQQDSDKP